MGRALEDAEGLTVSGEQFHQARTIAQKRFAVAQGDAYGALPVSCEKLPKGLGAPGVLEIKPGQVFVENTQGTRCPRQNFVNCCAMVSPAGDQFGRHALLLPQKRSGRGNDTSDSRRFLRKTAEGAIRRTKKNPQARVFLSQTGSAVAVGPAVAAAVAGARLLGAIAGWRTGWPALRAFAAGFA